MSSSGERVREYFMPFTLQFLTYLHILNLQWSQFILMHCTIFTTFYVNKIHFNKTRIQAYNAFLLLTKKCQAALGALASRCLSYTPGFCFIFNIFIKSMLKYYLALFYFGRFINVTVINVVTLNCIVTNVYYTFGFVKQKMKSKQEKFINSPITQQILDSALRVPNFMYKKKL